MADRGFTVMKQSRIITAGDITLDILLDADGMPLELELTLPNGDEINVSAEHLDRAAKVIDGLRSDAGDYRSVCPTHGYFERKTFGSCEQCAAEKASSEAAAS